jgi:hypothetical protein
MKTLSTLSTTKSFLVIAGIVVLAPLAYAAAQVGTGGNMSSIVVVQRSGGNLDAIRIGASKVENESKVEVRFVPVEKAKKGIVQSLDKSNDSFVILVKGTPLYVLDTATTTFYFGNGEVATIDDIAEGTTLYAFGYMRSDNEVMVTSKIVIANKSKLDRK